MKPFVMIIAAWFGLGIGADGSRPISLMAQELDQATFLELHNQLNASPEAPWRTIPWKISLLEAQQEAAQSGKPIFIWAMDGHPLGCV